MISFRQGADGELSFIKEFAQEAFNEFDFAQMLPKLYADNAKSEPMHYVLYDDNEAKGLFALQLKTFCIADITVRVGWIGSVCVKSGFRGKGYLSHIMQYAKQLLKQHNCDLAVLGGQRQRYKHFGYEYGGSHWIFTLTSKNILHIDADNLSIKPLDDNSKWLDDAYALYCKENFSGARSKEEFCTVLKSWSSRPCAIVNGNSFTGYCSLSICGDGIKVYEMRLINSDKALNACKAVLNECKKDQLIIYQCLWADRELSNLLGSECESACLAENHSYNVFNWQKIILAGLMLKLKCKMPMQPGTAYVSIENCGIYKITIDADVKVESCEKAESLDLQLTQLQAVQALLGHTSICGNSLPAGWLPLPLGFSWLDGI